MTIDTLSDKTILEEAKCILCNAAKSNLIGTFLFGKKNLGLVKCPNCGLIYTNPRLPASSGKKYFQEFHKVSKKELQYWYKNKYPILQQITVFLKKYYAGTLLDIGCGYGFLLNKAKELGWAVSGIEISSPNCEYVKQIFGFDVFNGYLNESPFKDRSFNVITIIDTLYYSYDPLNDLKKTNRLLDVGGILILRETNRAYYICIWQYLSALFKRSRYLDDNPFFYGMKDHLYFFGPHSLRKVLTRAGYRRLKFYNSVMANQKSNSKLDGFIRSFCSLLLNIIWLLSWKRICLAPSIIVVAEK